jgi:hypothetical protein
MALVVLAYNASTWKAEDHEFKASPGYRVRPCLKQTNKQTQRRVYLF